MPIKQYNTVKDYMDDMQGVATNNSLLRQLQNESSANTSMASATPVGTSMSTRSVSPSRSVSYDPNVDYSDLIAQEAAKGVNANKDLLAQYEAQRNAKIQGMGLNYNQTNIYGNNGGAYTTDVGVGTIVNMGKPDGYYTAQDKSDLVNQLYDAAIEAQKAALKSEYEKNLAAYDAQKEKLPQIYQQAKNQTASDAAVAQQSMNERFAASGLNTGAQGQAALSMNTALQGNLSALDADRAEKLADIEAQRTQAMVDYQNAIAQAIANNEMERAQALYNEAIRVDNSYREQEQIFIQNSTTSSSGGGGYITDTSGYTPTPTPTPTPDYGTPDAGTPTLDATSLNYDQDEGTFRWNGKVYTSLSQLQSDIKNAGLTPEQLNSLEQKMNLFGFSLNTGSTGTTSSDNNTSQSALSVGEQLNMLMASGASNYQINMFLAEAEAKGLINAAQRMQYTRYAGLDGYTGTSSTPSLGSYATNLQSSFSRIPGLTEQNKVAMVRSAYEAGKITDYEADFLLNYLGY